MSLQLTEHTTKHAVEERLQNAVALKVEGRYQEAEAELRAVLEAEPENARARREMGLVLNFIGMFDESIEELRRAVATDAAYLEARVDLALAYSMLGMMDEARAELEAVLEIDPMNAAAQRHIVYFR
jgi:tetratricopeptide (TPR) repeat protein